MCHFRCYGRNPYKKGSLFGRFEDTKISFRDKLTFKNESYLKVRGHASEDMKMDSVMSSKTWRRNSALAQASVVDSILFGFNSQDW